MGGTATVWSSGVVLLCCARDVVFNKCSTLPGHVIAAKNPRYLFPRSTYACAPPVAMCWSAGVAVGGWERGTASYRHMCGI